MTVIRLKSAAALSTAIRSSEERPLLSLDLIESGTGKLLRGTEVPIQVPPESGVAEAEPGDVLFGKLRPYLSKSLLVDMPSYASTELLCLRPTPSTDSRWLAYVVQSRPFVDWTVATSDGTKMPRTSWEKASGFRVDRPGLAEQRAIADFLDAETARIDALVARKRRLIGLLGERSTSHREALVTGTGKSSGIPSLGEVPPNWEMLRNKVFLREVNDPSPDGTGEMLSVSHLTGVTPRSEKTVYMFEAESTVGYKRVRPGDLVINTMWAWMGAAGVSSHAGIVSPAYGVYRFYSDRVLPEFYEILIRAPGYIEEMTRFSRGVTSSRLRLYPDEFLRLLAPVPPIQEQRKLVSEFAVWATRKDGLVDRLGRQIERLIERRQALITAAVTGALAVPGAS